MDVPLWLVLSIAGMLLAIMLACIPYIIWQVKQSFTQGEAIKVLLEHVRESRTHNGRALDYQGKMEHRIDSYSEGLARMEKLIINNTEAMNELRISLGTRTCLYKGNK